MYIDLLVLIFASNRHSMSKEKIKNALNRYYKAFDYDEGTLAYKRGGQMGFGKKHEWGGPNGTTWISEIDQTPVDESFIYDANGQISGLGTDYYIRQYWNQHPEEYFKMQGIDDSIIADWSSKQNGSGFGKVSGSDITKGITQAGTTLKNFGKSAPTLGKNINMSTPWSAIAGTAGSLTVDLQRAIDSYIRSKDKHVYNPMHSAGLYKKGGNKFEGGGFSSNPMDMGNSFLKIASNAVHQGSLTTDYDTFEDALERYENNQINALNNISDNDALMMAYANHGALSPDDIRARDFRDKTVLGDITDGLASSFEGFNSTGNWIGAVVGGVSSNIGSIIGRRRAAKAAKKAQEASAIANKDWDSRYFHAVQDVDRMNDTRRLIGFYNNPFDYAYGGEMRTHGADFNNGLTFINEGGTHEENPYEGVPSGVDEEGVPNLVEEGEVIWNNEYVFSNRIKVPKHLAKKYKLGGDFTFADAIKKVTKESLTRPNDPISNETNKAIVNEFMDEQEALREKEQQNAARQLQRAYDEDFMEQMDSMQQMPMAQGAPVDMGAQLPMQESAPVEGMPPGFAFGGNKFQNGSWKDYVTEGKDKAGTTIYTTSDGMVFYSEAGAKKYIDLNRETLISRLPDFTPSPTASRMVAERSEPNLPEGIQVVYSKGINGRRGPIHHYETSDGRNMGLNLDKAITEQNKINSPQSGLTARASENPQDFIASLQNWEIPEVSPTASRQPEPRRTGSAGYAKGKSSEGYDRTKLAPEVEAYLKTLYREGSPVYKEKYKEALDRQNRRWDAQKQREREAAEANARFKQEQAERAQRLNEAEAYKKKRGYGALTPMSSEDRQIYNDILNGVRNSKGETITPKSEPQQAQQSQQPQTNVQYDKFAAPLPSDEVPNAQEGITTQSTQQSGRTTYSGTQSAAPASGGVPQSSGRQGGSGVGVPSRRDTIDYDRKLGLEKSREWEAQEDYQNFLKYMRGQGKDSPEAKEWMDFIQSEIKKSGSNYELKDFDDWSNLAEDGKIGPVHKATLTAAQNYAKRNSGNPIMEPIATDNVPDGRVTGPNEGLAGEPAVSTTPSGSSATTTGTSSGAPVNDDSFGYDLARLAPIIGTGIMAANSIARGPIYDNADAIIEAARRAGVPVNIPVQTIGDYMTYKPFDERYLVNMANQNRAAATRGIVNTSNGNRAMDILGNMTLAHSNQQELGEIARNAYLANQQQRSAVAEFNRGTNVQNMTAINSRNLAQAQLNSQRQATELSGLARGYGLRQDIWKDWRNDRDANIEAFLDNLHQYSRDRFYDNQTQGMIDSGYFNGYRTNNLGNIWFAKVSKGGNKKKRRF